MREVVENLERIRDRGTRVCAREVCDKADAAGIALLVGVVETLLRSFLLEVDELRRTSHCGGPRGLCPVRIGKIQRDGAEGIWSVLGTLT